MSGNLRHELLKRCSRRATFWLREPPGPQELPCRACPRVFWLHLRPVPGSLRRSLPVCSRHADV